MDHGRQLGRDVAPSAGSTLLFTGETGTSPVDDYANGTSFASIDVAAPGFSLSGDSFAITDGLTVDAGVGGTTTIANAISGTGAVTQEGSGTLTLSGTNTYSGGTTINAGVLQIGNGNATGSLAAGGVTDNGSLSFDLATPLSSPIRSAAQGRLPRTAPGR